MTEARKAEQMWQSRAKKGFMYCTFCTFKDLATTPIFRQRKVECDRKEENRKIQEEKTRKKEKDGKSKNRESVEEKEETKE